MSWPALVLWALVVPLSALRGPALIYATLAANVLMSLQMLPTSGPGATLLPVTVFEAALIARCLLAPGALVRGLDAAFDMRRLGLFTAFLVYALLSAFILPRMFANMVAVIPVSGASLDSPSLLAPRSGNITQSCYMIVSYLTVLTFCLLGGRHDQRRHVLRAIIFGGYALIFTGLADIVASRIGAGALLDPFRTASYELMTDVELGGVKRVVGLTPEASTFGGLCVQTLAALLFLRPVFQPGLERLLGTVALIGVAAMALLSTSSTAYVGGFVTACVFFIDLLRRLHSRSALGKSSLPLEFAAMAAAAFGVIVVILFVPSVADWVYGLLDKLIFKKSDSLSYVQRTMWSRVGWEAFINSGGLGVGLGSVRTSNWMVSILSSTGVFGGALMFSFLLQRLLARGRSVGPWERSFSWGLRMFLVPTLVMSSLAGTMPDLGLLLSVVLGLLSATPHARAARAQPVAPSPHLASARTPVEA